MMFRTAVLVLALALAATVTACGGSSKPAPPANSAAAACRDFSTWYLDQPGNILALKDSSLLSRAVSKAPAGSSTKT
jgi:hypothetical protein